MRVWRKSNVTAFQAEVEIAKFSIRTIGDNMNYPLTREERDFALQILASESFALNRGSSEDYLHAIREKADFYENLKTKYNIQKDAAMNLVFDTGIIITNE